MANWTSGMAQFLLQYGIIGLFIVAFVEASFFPLPPYLISIPLTLANPKWGFLYALVGTIGSVFGGLFGYILGSRLGHPILLKFLKTTTLQKVEGFYKHYGDWATLIGGITPLPYKIFALFAGVFRTRVTTFILASIFARGIRFFGEAILLMLYGRRVLGLLKSVLSPVYLLTITGFIVIMTLAWRTGFIRRDYPVMRRLKALEGSLSSRLHERAFKSTFYSWYLISGATLIAFCIIVFTKLASELLEHELTHFDASISALIIAYRSGWLTQLMLGITNFGSVIVIVGLDLTITVAGLFYRKRLQVIFLNIALVGASFLSELLKHGFHRLRPSPPWLAPASGYSFPSGHSLISITFYGCLAYWLFRNYRWQRGKYLFTGIILALPIFIGISRVYLGVHFPSDVLAGWIVAVGWVATCITGMEYTNSKAEAKVRV